MSSKNYIVKALDLENLAYLVLDVDIVETDSELSLFHHSVLKCRELIFTVPHLLATPTLQEDIHRILAVVPKTIYDSPDFQDRLKKIGLKLFQVQDASNSILQKCFRYTIIAKIAPSWNLVDDLLVQGQDFLTADGPLSAIKLDVVVAEEEIHLNLQTSCIKIPHLKLANYEKRRTEGNIPLTIPLDDARFVLPKLTQAKIVSLTNYIPKESRFKDYQDLKKHWKNMYGYCLPNLNPEEEWYCNIEFHVPGIFTYPILCVCPSGTVLTLRENDKEEESLSNFLADFHRNIDNICGQSCQLVENKTAFP